MNFVWFVYGLTLSRCFLAIAIASRFSITYGNDMEVLVGLVCCLSLLGWIWEI